MIAISKMQKTATGERKKSDGTRFLNMLREAPYSSCSTVGTLVKKISSKRNKLLEEYKSLEKYINGYQLSLFEDVAKNDELSFCEAKQNREKLEQEIKWLHKCLGICMNPAYFKQW